MWKENGYISHFVKKESKKYKTMIVITRLDQSNVLDWQVSSILLKT